MLARCLDEENYDLGGETLMVSPLTGALWSAGAAFGFRVLSALEDRDGMLPAPGAAPAEVGKRDRATSADERLARGYHTAYVMGLLCAAALARGRAPPLDFPVQPAPERGLADAVLRFLDDEGPSPFWRLPSNRQFEGDLQLTPPRRLQPPTPVRWRQS